MDENWYQETLLMAVKFNEQQENLQSWMMINGDWFHPSQRPQLNKMSVSQRPQLNKCIPSDKKMDNIRRIWIKIFPIMFLDNYPNFWIKKTRYFLDCYPKCLIKINAIITLPLPNCRTNKSPPKLFGTKNNTLTNVRVLHLSCTITAQLSKSTKKQTSKCTGFCYWKLVYIFL